jgi:hypothetical protein
MKIGWKKVGSGAVSATIIVAIIWFLFQDFFVSEDGADMKNPWLWLAIAVTAVIALTAWFVHQTIGKAERGRKENLFREIIGLPDSDIIELLFQFGDEPFFTRKGNALGVNPQLFGQISQGLLGEVIAEILRIMTAGKDKTVNPSEDDGLFDSLAQCLLDNISHQNIDELMRGVGVKPYIAHRLQQAMELHSRRQEIRRIMAEMKNIEERQSAAEEVKRRIQWTVEFPPTPIERLKGWFSSLWKGSPAESQFVEGFKRPIPRGDRPSLFWL